MKNLFFSSLRNSLVTLVLLAVLPALGVILHSSLENRQRAIRDAQDDALRAARFVAGEQQLITMRAEQMLSLLAQMPQIREHDGAATGAILRRLKGSSRIFANIVALDVHGRVFASALPPDRQSFAGREFTDALERGEFSVAEDEPGGTTAKDGPAIRFFYPVAGEDGEISGLLSTVLRPSRYERILSLAALPPGSVLSLADRRGVRLYRHPEAAETSPAGGRLVMEHWDLVNGSLPTGTAVVTQADGVRRIVAFVQLRLRQEGSPYLYVSVGIPEKLALAGAVANLHRDLLLLVGAAVLAILVAWGVGGIVIGRPVERLAEVARRLGGGDLDARSGGPEEFGELEVLAETLDNMADALSEDIAAREAAEAESRKSEAFLRMILDALPVGVWMSDPQGRVLYVNRASRDIWAAGPGGASEFGAVFAAWRPGSEAPIRPREFVLSRAIAGETPLRPQVLEIPGGGRSGRAVVECSAVPIRGETGELRAVIVVLADITERTQREQARESIERMMRHDLRSPLVGFVSLPQLLLRQPNLTEEQRGWVARLQKSAGAMLRSLDAYLKLSRIERGNLEIETVLADLVQLARGVRAELEALPQCAGRHALLTVNGRPIPEGRTFALECEPSLFASMLSNLLKNALEASPEGGITEVDMSDLDESVRIEVRNPGEVPRSVRSRFFEKYVTAGKPGGTGIGTYSAKRIAEFHGGSVALDCSRPGWTAVRVVVPKNRRLLGRRVAEG